MTIAIGLALFVMIAGAVAYLITKDEWKEMGRIAFFVGLFFVVSGAGAALSLVVK